MIPARFAPVLFGLILSGLSTFRALGLVEPFPLISAGNWAVSRAVAFPTVLIVAPITRRIVARLVG